MIVKKLTTLLDFDLDRASLAAAKAVASDVKASLAAASAGALALGAGLAWAIKKTVEAGGEAADTAQRLGLTAEAVQEFGYVAQLAGVQATEFSAGIARLAKKGGYESTEQALADLAERFSAMPDGIKKTGLAQEYFGRSGAQLIPFLNEGADGLARLRQEARDLGVVISDDAAQGMEAFGDDLDRLKMAGDGLVYTLGGALIPELQTLATELLGWLQQNRALLQQKVTEWTQKLVRGVRDLVRWARDLHARIQPLVEKMGGWESVLKKLIVAVVAFKTIGLATSLIEISIAAAKAATALKAMGAASLVNPIALLAVAMLGVGLALDDIKTYAEGGDSAVGRFLDRFQGADGIIGGATTALEEFLDALGILQDRHKEQDVVVRFTADSTSQWWDEFFLRLTDRLWNLKTLLIAVLAAPLMPFYLAYQAIMAAFGEDIEKLGQRMKTFYDGLVEEASRVIESMVNGIASFIERSLALIRDEAIEIGRSVSGAVTGGARSLLPPWIADRVLPNTATPGASNQSISLTAGPVTVNANTGASPAEIGRAVQQAQQDGLAPLLRQAWRTLAPAED